MYTHFVGFIMSLLSLSLVAANMVCGTVFLQTLLLFFLFLFKPESSVAHLTVSMSQF